MTIENQHPTITNLLRDIPFFEGLPELNFQKAIAHVVTREHPPNQVILLENDWGGAVYFVLHGWVKIRTYNVEGKEITLNILGRGELFGEMAALEDVPRSTDVITLTDTKIASIPAGDFVELINTEPMAGLSLAKLMGKRLRQVNRKLRLREADAMSRVADTLMFLSEGQGKKSNQGMEIPNLPHRELSSLCGLARETVTRTLTKLEKKNLIQREHDYIFVPNLEALEHLIG
jgi:CRP-like cAMP-binding protein